MANTDKPMGFLPESDDAPKHSHELSSTNSEILKGYPVYISGGYVTNASAAGGAGSVCGIAAEYKAANSGGYLMVWDDPETRFICQEDGVGTTSAVTHKNYNADFVATHTSHNGVDAACELDMSTVNTTSTLAFRILGLADQLDLEAGAANAWGAHAKLVVKINAHQFAYTTGS